MPYITIPTILKKYTHQTERLKVSGDTVKACLTQLFQHFPQLETLLFKEPGVLSQYVNLYVNNNNVSNILDWVMKADDELTIIPALSGG